MSLRTSSLILCSSSADFPEPHCYAEIDFLVSLFETRRTAMVATVLPLFHIMLGATF